MEINFRKLKWLLPGTYHPPPPPPPQVTMIISISITLDALDIYMQNYDKFILVGGFNAEEVDEILWIYATFLVKEYTCFKSVGNPSCVELQNTDGISTGKYLTVIKWLSLCWKPRSRKPKESLRKLSRGVIEMSTVMLFVMILSLL